MFLKYELIRRCKINVLLHTKFKYHKVHSSKSQTVIPEVCITKKKHLTEQIVSKERSEVYKVEL